MDLCLYHLISSGACLIFNFKQIIEITGLLAFNITCINSRLI